MTDDPKIVPLDTGYKPETPPPDASEVRDLHWSVMQLVEEIQAVSRGLRALVRGLTKIGEKIDSQTEKLDELLERK